MRIFRNTIFPDLKCPEHGVYDVWPCPWPQCKNGISEDRFNVEPLVEGKEPGSYTRREWKSLSGEPYFTWDEVKIPNWFGVSKVVANEARRQGLMGARPPDRIYHYTNVQGLYGIVQSGQLWLSDYSYLNDTRELSHGADLVVDVVTERMATEVRPEVIELLRIWIAELQAPVHRVCVASFSELGDSLSQWRAYGSIAIGFEPRDVSLHAYGANLSPVEYRRDRQRAFVELHIHHTVEAFLVDLHSSRLVKIPDVYQKLDRLVEMIAFFKDPAFAAEQEYRLAFIEHPELMPSLGFNSTAKRFRVARERIIPYVLSNELQPVLASGERPLMPREIVLGPGADPTLERGIRELLLENDMKEVEVKRSGVPYRT